MVSYNTEDLITLKSDIRIRPATADDAQGLQRDCWSDWPLEVVTEVLIRMERFAQQRRGQGVVAYYGEWILGYGQITVWPRLGEISDLIVAPGYRGLGIGTRLIQTLVEKGRTWKLPAMEIGAALSNPRALALYQRLGFTESKRINLDLGNGSETVVYLILDLMKPE